MFGFVKLPTSPDQFDQLVSKIVKKYKLKDANHAAAIISLAIRHLPNNKAYTTYRFLGHTILKNIANQVANHKAEVIKHNGQVDQLVSMITQDPSNQQARDELQKAADEGSEKAKLALHQIEVLESQAIIN